MLNGIWYEDPTRVKEIFREHFINLFSKKGVDEIFDTSPIFHKQLNGEEKSMLEANINKGELLYVVNSMDSNKSLGPDGMNAAYLKEFWHLINKDVAEDIYSRRVLPV